MLSTIPEAKSQISRLLCQVGTTAWQPTSASRSNRSVRLRSQTNRSQVACHCDHHCRKSHHPQHSHLHRSLLLLRHVMLLQLLQLLQVLRQLLRMLRRPRKISQQRLQRPICLSAPSWLSTPGTHAGAPFPPWTTHRIIRGSLRWATVSLWAASVCRI